MKKQVLLIVLLVASSALGVRSQTIQDGDWIGKIIHRSGYYMDVIYEVRNSKGSLQITLQVEQYGPFEFKNIRITADSLYFVWTPAFDLPCTLARLPDGVYHGVCKDPWGGFGGAIMAPPGSDRDLLRLDEETFLSIAGVNPDDSTPKEWLLGELYPKGSTVELDGGAVNYVDVGNSPVTVILMSGLGDNLSSWESLQQHLASDFRVIAYDRPGLGLSEGSESSRTPERMAKELKHLLQNIDVSPPYLLVAHAEASWAARQYADLYAEEVQGLVLIHPHHEHQAELWETLDSESWNSYWTRVKRFQSMLPGAISQEFNVYAGIIDGEDVLDLSKVPPVPTFVLSAGRASEAPRWIGDSEEGRQAWSEFHASWVEEMPQGQHMIIESSPYIHQEQPERVAEVIQNMISAK
ncbi:MAG: alpha/beta hydrolase [Bacteroidetes bacterium]|nr:alpha/beta hydrolase [Bacteroidota bacterium]